MSGFLSLVIESWLRGRTEFDLFESLVLYSMEDYSPCEVQQSCKVSHNVEDSVFLFL